MGLGVSGMVANCGAEIFGVAALGSSGDVVRLLEFSEIIGLEGGFWILGILRLSDSSMLELSRVLGGTELGSGFVNGVTSLNDGMVGAGLDDCWIVAGGGGEEGEAGAFTGSWAFGGTFA